VPTSWADDEGGRRQAHAQAHTGAHGSPAALLVAAAACAGELDESLTSLKRGDCVRAPDQASADEEVSEVDQVSCSESGVLRVASIVEVTGYAEYPGVEQIEGLAADRCSASTVFTLYPTGESWKAGDREIVCFSE
jgi:hypothetical protein